MTLRTEVTRIISEIESDKLPCTEASRELSKALNSTVDEPDFAGQIEECEYNEVLNF